MRSSDRRGDRAELGIPDFVVLGMVRLGARSGYEIKQFVEISIRFFWTISQVQIYPSLKRLEEKGFVRGQADPRGKRARRTYRITARGQRALETWLLGDEPMPFELRDIGMVKLFFADALQPFDAASVLVAFRKRSEERVVALRSIEAQAEAAGQDGNPHPLLTLQLGIAFHEAMIEVCADYEDRFAPA